MFHFIPGTNQYFTNADHVPWSWKQRVKKSQGLS